LVARAAWGFEMTLTFPEPRRVNVELRALFIVETFPLFVLTRNLFLLLAMMNASPARWACQVEC